MSVLTAYANMTLAEAHKREGYDGMYEVLGELQTAHDFMDEIPFYPANNGDYHKYLQGKRLGKGGFSKANAPVPTISSSADELSEPVKLYEGDSKIDNRVLAGVKDKRATRDSEDAMNLEGMIGDWIYNVFYSNSGDAFKGLAARRATLGDYCINVGGSGSDLSSMWVFEFGPAGFHMRYNSNGVPGIVNKDMGLRNTKAPTGDGEMWAWIRHYEIWAAIILRNERAMIRLPNIETTGETNNLISDPAKVILAKNKLQSFGRNAISFVNRTLKAQIDTAAFNKTNAAFSVRDIKEFGPMTSIASLPVRCIEQILDTESAIAS